MNVRDFEYIAKIARFNSISKAAESLYVSQPTLTKFLQKIEKEIGHDLFYRSGKKFSPTPIGEIYIAYEEIEKLQQIKNSDYYALFGYKLFFCFSFLLNIQFFLFQIKNSLYC